MNNNQNSLLSGSLNMQVNEHLKLEFFKFLLVKNIHIIPYTLHTHKKNGKIYRLFLISSGPSQLIIGRTTFDPSLVRLSACLLSSAGNGIPSSEHTK